MDCVPQRLKFDGFIADEFISEARTIAENQVKEKANKKDRAFDEFYDLMIAIYNELFQINKKLAKSEKLDAMHPVRRAFRSVNFVRILRKKLGNKKAVRE